VQQLHVRTCVARTSKLKDYTEPDREHCGKRVARGCRSMQACSEVYGLFASEYDYRPRRCEEAPLQRFRPETRQDLPGGSCTATARSIAWNGSWTWSPTTASSSSTITAPRKRRATTTSSIRGFGLATFVGVNSPLEAYFADTGRCKKVRPAGDSRASIRAVQQEPSTETIARFYECFDDAATRSCKRPINQARGCAKAADSSWLRRTIRKRCVCSRANWVLLNEVSMFLTSRCAIRRHGANLARSPWA